MYASVRAFGRKTIAAVGVAALLAGGVPLMAFAAAPLTVTLTSTAPMQPAQTAQNPIPVTATFSEGVTNFAANDLNVGNGTVVNFASSSSSVYTFGIVPGAPSGSVSVDINGGMVTGVDSQTNQASSQIQFIYNPSAGDAATTTATTTPTTASSTAYLALSLYSGPPGTAFSALGTNFAPSESVSVAFGGATSTAVADAGGSVTVPLSVASLATTGPASIVATGQTSGLVASNSFYVEPAGTATSTSGGPSLTITSGPANGSSTNQPIVTFAFTTDPGATTTCQFNGSFACASPVTLGSTTLLADGNYTFSVTSTNASSTASTTVSRTFSVDTVAPTVAEVTPVPTSGSDQSPSYTFSSSEPGTITLGGGCTSATASTAMGTTTIALNALAAGTYDCTLTVTDAAGNVSNTLAMTPFVITDAASSGASGGGGGGGGIVGSGPLSIGYVNTDPYGTGAAPAAASVTPPAQVLGASTYNFTKPLQVGSSGADVTALQNILISEGYSIPAGATGYFGTETKTAVTAFQKAHGLAQVGSVGPLTRAILNEGSIPTTPETTSTSTSAATGSSSNLSTAQVQSILGLLQSFGADQTTIANVQAALGTGH